MISKKGSLVLRDVFFMIMMVSAIFVLTGLMVSEMAINYDNTNMTNEWGITQTNSIANSTFYDTGEDLNETGEGLRGNTGILSFLSGALDGVGTVLTLTLNAPSTIASLTSATLIDAGVPFTIAKVINYLIFTLFWAIIIFTIVSAFLQGGKL